jgi:hypothetical protein
MNIKRAKSMALSVILDKLGLKPSRPGKTQSLYLSPLREERTASFAVHHAKNLWFDHGMAESGDVMKFGCAWLKSQGRAHAVPDALQWLQELNIPVAAGPLCAPAAATETEAQEQTLGIKSATPIKHRTLKHYLEQRGIPLDIAKRYLKELRIHNAVSGKTFFALGLLDEDEGYEIRNVVFKGCIGAKDISFIRGRKAKQNTLHIFEGMMDYLSLVAMNKGELLNDEAIVLNSLSQLNRVKAYIRDYTYKVVLTWMDNDAAGRKAVKAWDEFFDAETDILHTPMNAAYKEYKDVNEWRMAKMKQKRVNDG